MSASDLAPALLVPPHASSASRPRRYVVIRRYTADWTWTGLMAASTTTTEFTSYRVGDNAIALVFNLLCGSATGGVNVNGRGIGCYNLASGSANPSGGSGCNFHMGSGSTSSGWHRIQIYEHNSDSYIYACNGPQHSSSYTMNHRLWFRQHVPYSPPTAPPSPAPLAPAATGKGSG